MAAIRISWQAGEVIANLQETPATRKLLAALPYGPTPISKKDECRLASKCNVLGLIEGDPRQLQTVRDGEAIRVELV